MRTFLLVNGIVAAWNKWHDVVWPNDLALLEHSAEMRQGSEHWSQLRQLLTVVGLLVTTY